jgi:hypothetical protein
MLTPLRVSVPELTETSENAIFVTVNRNSHVVKLNEDPDEEMSDEIVPPNPDPTDNPIVIKSNTPVSVTPLPLEPIVDPNVKVA